jgi:hypothetical protein
MESLMAELAATRKTREHIERLNLSRIGVMTPGMIAVMAPV